MKIGKVLNERWELKGKIADRQDFEEYDPFAFGNGTNKKKYRGGTSDATSTLSHIVS